jgi:PhnB protein
MTFYQSVLGGKLELSTFGDSPMPSTPEQKEKIVHATLQNDTLSFMACDAMPTTVLTAGNTIHLSIAGNDLERLTAIFHGLSQGGHVDMPLAQQFWGDTFGMVTDQFGVRWMVNIAGTQRTEAKTA